MPPTRESLVTDSADRRRRPTAADLAFVGDRRVGRLATADEAGRPAAVPVCYALIERIGEPVVVSPLDDKPKRVAPRELARVRRILARPEVALVVDDYHEEWSRLAWVELRGRARLLEVATPGHEAGVSALRAKYPQYAAMAIDERPLIAIGELTAAAWRGGEATATLPSAARVGDAELAGIIRGRRSVRAFRPDPVPRAVVEAAIAAAGWAPSPHGRQPWRFAVVEVAARRAALADAMAETWREQLAMDGQSPAIVELRLEKSRSRLRDAPILVVPCLYLDDLDVYPDPDRQAAEATMAAQSLGAAIQNLLLTLYAGGLDAGWMCAPLFCPEVVRAALDLPPSLTPHALLPIGYAAKEPVRRDRLPWPDLIISWE